jgi:hypothetical protein
MNSANADELFDNVTEADALGAPGAPGRPAHKLTSKHDRECHLSIAVSLTGKRFQCSCHVAKKQTVTLLPPQIYVP